MLKKRRKESRRGGSSCSRALATKRKPPRKKAQADGLAPLTTWPGWPHCPVTISGGLAWLAAGHKAHSHNGRRVGWLGKKKGFAKKKKERRYLKKKSKKKSGRYFTVDDDVDGCTRPDVSPIATSGVVWFETFLRFCFLVFFLGAVPIGDVMIFF